MDTHQTYAAYLPHIKARWAARHFAWEKLRKKARAEACQIAAMLRATFGAERVIVYGSLTAEGPFDEQSDIDLAVGGIKSADFFRAYAQAMALSPNFKLDMIDLADCTPQMYQSILQSGVEL